MLSVVIPVYNEQDTVATLIGRVASVEYGIGCEVIVVDDASTDGTPAAVAAAIEKHTHVPIRTLRHEHNRGKGAALRTGFADAQGEYVIVQDADLEYDPRDIPRLLRPLLEGEADVVYGTRFTGGQSHRVLYFWHSLANRLLTLISNAFTNLNLTDMECCYKLFRKDVLDRLNLVEDRFGFEPEVTAKLAKLREDGKPLRIFEVGVSYAGRTYAEGKKIGLRDGWRALWCVLKYNLWG